MLRVALVCLLSGSGGVERHVVDLAAELGRAADVVVVTIAGGWLAREATARHLRVAAVPECRGNFDARALMALRATLQRIRPDVVHSHVGRSDWYAWLATAGMRPVLVSTEHGISDDRPELYGGRATRVAHRLAHDLRLRQTDAVIAVSQYTARALMRRYPVLRRRPPVVVFPSVDVQTFARARHPEVMPSGTLRVLCLSRLSYEKGVDVLVRAVAIAVARGAPLCATIAGDGECRGSLEQLAAELNAEANVTFLGRVADVAGLLQHTDVLVIPSRSENLPLAALEALAAGVPVAASDVGGLNEVVKPGRTGWLVPSDDASALAMLLYSLSDGIPLRGVSPRCAAQGGLFEAGRMILEVLDAYEPGDSH